MTRRVPRYLREEPPKPIDWDEYGHAIEPLESAARSLRQGNPAGLPVAVAFLVERPRFFGSGYLFEDLAGAVAVGPDAGPLADDLRHVVLRDARVPITSETPYVARIAARYWNGELGHDLALIDSDAACFVRTRASQVRRSYAALGLVAD